MWRRLIIIGLFLLSTSAMAFNPPCPDDCCGDDCQYAVCSQLGCRDCFKKSFTIVLAAFINANQDSLLYPNPIIYVPSSIPDTVWRPPIITRFLV